MSDLIDRQAAIDAFDCTNELIVGGEANARNVANYINKVIGKIKDLPSAQPEIIRCKDCKYMTEHYDTDGNAPYWACSEWDSGTDYDGFCHYAERRGK